MARDDDKLLFSSSWDIDQIYKQGETSVTVPASTTTETTVETFAALSDRPWMDLTFKVSGGSYWHQPGGTTNPTTDDNSGVATYWKTTTTGAVVGVVNGTGSSRTVTVRYYVFTDVRAV